MKIVGDTLWVPDFSGNRYMNTLGNMLAEPRAALLFLDFINGDVLHVQGHTAIRWQDDAQHRLEGAERYWSLQITSAWRFLACCRGKAAIANSRPPPSAPACGPEHIGTLSWQSRGVSLPAGST